MANATRQGLTLRGVTEDSNVHELSEDQLKQLILAAMDVTEGYEPPVRSYEVFAAYLQRITEDDSEPEQAKPLEDMSQEELLQLLKKSWSKLLADEVVQTGPVKWDGSQGEPEKRAIAHLGLLIEAYESVVIQTPFKTVL